jgi:invasion protein IalB
MNRLLPLAAALAFLAAPAFAQTAAPDVKRIGDFTVRCFPVKSVSPCDMYEERGNKDTGQRVLSLSIAYMPAASRYVMQITVPLGVSIEKGVVIAAGSFTSPVMPYRRCDQAGCYVEASIGKDLIDAFAKAGGDAKIKIVADGGKSFDFPFSFSGFAAAHDDMVAQNKAKATAPDQASPPVIQAGK